MHASRRIEKHQCFISSNLFLIEIMKHKNGEKDIVFIKVVEATLYIYIYIYIKGI